MSEKYEIRLGDALKEAWGIFMKGPEVFVGLTFLYVAILWACGTIPVAGPLISLVAWALLLPAFFVVAEGSAGKDRATFDPLQTLVPLLPQLLAANIVKNILISVGFLLLVLPGLFLMVLFFFTELLVVLDRKQFVDALKESKNLAMQNFLGVVGLMLFCFFLALSGFLLVGIGVLVTLPMSALVLYCVYRRARVRAVVVA